MRTPTAPPHRSTKAPVVKIDHSRIQDDPEYRHTIREALAIAVDRATAAQAAALTPVIVPEHEPSGACCIRERRAISEARLLGALQAARPRH
jgi:hypothetical protein